MAEVRWIKRSFVLMLVLQFTAAGNDQLVLTGDEASLSCENVIEGQEECKSTTWFFRSSRRGTSVELVTLGRICENAKNKSDRLRISEDCSLLIKNITAEDAGLYICQQYISGQKQGQEPQIILSVVTTTRQKKSDEMTLSCSVSTYERCTHKVNLLYNNNQVEDNKSLKTSPCFASLECPTDRFTCQSGFKFWKCQVKVGERVQEFPFGPWPSGDTTGKDTITSTTESTATKPTGMTHDASIHLKDFWWLYVTVAVVLVALLIVVVKVVRRKRTEGNKTRMNDTVGLTSNPAVTPPAAETSQDTADPEDGVSYASISYTKKTNSKAQVPRRDDDSECFSVTYLTVKAPSTDPSDLYATVN